MWSTRPSAPLLYDIILKSLIMISVFHFPLDFFFSCSVIYICPMAFSYPISSRRERLTDWQLGPKGPKNLTARNLFNPIPSRRERLTDWQLGPKGLRNLTPRNLFKTVFLLWVSSWADYILLALWITFMFIPFPINGNVICIPKTHFSNLHEVFPNFLS